MAGASPWSLQRPPDLAVFKGSTSKVEEGKGKRGGKGKGKGGEGKGREGRGERPYTPPVANSWLCNWPTAQIVHNCMLKMLEFSMFNFNFLAFDYSMENLVKLPTFKRVHVWRNM